MGKNGMARRIAGMLLVLLLLSAVALAEGTDGEKSLLLPDGETPGEQAAEETPVAAENEAAEVTPVVEENEAVEVTPVVEENEAVEVMPVVEENEAAEEQHAENQSTEEEQTIAAPLPQVNIVSTGNVGILELTDEQIVTEAMLTYTEGKRSFSYPVTVKWQGNSTLQYDKKNYTIKFYTDEAFHTKQKVNVRMAWGAHSKYCLKANYTDSTQSRNIVSARLAAEINRAYNIFNKAPNAGLIDGFPVEVTIDGQYWGIYTWNIPKDGWMLRMDKKNGNHLLYLGFNETSDSLLFRQEAKGMDDLDWTLEEGPGETQEQMKSSAEKLNRAIRFVMNASDEEFRADFGKYFNLDAALNYYCFVYYTNTSDNLGKNLLLATMDGQIWYPLLYDLDTSFGLYFSGEGIYSAVNRAEDFSCGGSLLWQRLVRTFPQELYDRYRELRAAFLNEEHILGLFEAFSDLIPAEAWARERERWPEVPGQEFDLDSIREHIQAREPFVDGIFSQLPHEAASYADQRLLFALDAPYQGSANGYLDTGLNLFNEERDFTVVLKVRSGAEGSGYGTILANANNAGEGLEVHCSGDGTDDYTIFYCGEHTYEALYALQDDGCAYVAVRRQNGGYTLIGRSLDDTRAIKTKQTGEIATNLCLGASYYMHENGRISAFNHYCGVIEACEVYGCALSDEEIMARMTAMKE